MHLPKFVIQQSTRVLLRPKVLHSLPGRVRIHVPALRHIPVDSKDRFAAPLAHLIALPEGIDNVEISFQTGNLLIRYDPDKITENEIVAWNKQLGGMVLQVWDRLQAVSTEQLPNVMLRLEGVLQNAIHYRLDPQEVTIPDDVWP